MTAEASSIRLETVGAVFVVRMTDGENRMNRTWLDGVSAALDRLDAAPDPKALVTTGDGRFYSNGLDLEWLTDGPEDMRTFVIGVEAVFARILAASYPTVAACNGHTFAAGAMLAMAHDFRIMRSDRGWFCLPEVDLGIPLTAGMNALMTSRLPVVTAHEVLVMGGRFGGEEAVAKGIVTEAVPEADVLSRAIARAASLAEKAGPTMGAIKRRMYSETIDLLTMSGGAEHPA
jgi:enoyl-CoA hydratase/carnithine racemase